jgi:hypothetical protein
LNDPNFEQNRIEYKANKDAADKNRKSGRTVLKREGKCEHPDLCSLKVVVLTLCCLLKHHRLRLRLRFPKALLRRRRQRLKQQRL